MNETISILLPPPERVVQRGFGNYQNGLVMFNKFTTAGLNFPAQGSAEFNGTSDFIQLNTPFSYTKPHHRGVGLCE